MLHPLLRKHVQHRKPLIVSYEHQPIRKQREYATYGGSGVREEPRAKLVDLEMTWGDYLTDKGQLDFPGQ